MRRYWPDSLAQQLLMLEVLVVVLVSASGLAAYIHARQLVQDSARERTTAVEASVASSPLVVQAVGQADPSALLEPYVEQVRAATGTAFITVLAPDRTRFTHPDPSQIGQPFQGTIAPALAGHTFTETYAGTLGPSLRTTGPVLDAQGHVVALVSVGITVRQVGQELLAALPGILGAAVLTFLVGVLGSLAISRRLSHQTGGLGAAAMAKMLNYYSAVLHAIREGLVLLDARQQVQLANDEARRLLDLRDDPTGRHVTALGLSHDLTETLGAQRPAVDEVHVTGRRVLVLNQAPTQPSGPSAGTVITLRDQTELQALTGELASVRAFAETVRAQAHEAANRLHTTVSLVELGREQEAVAFAVAELAATQQLTDRVVATVEEPVLAALLLGKAASAHERGVHLEIDPASAIGSTGIPPGDLVTIVGNLIDNAIDAALLGDQPREVQVALWEGQDRLQIRVEDTGPGVAEPDVPRLFQRGWTTKDDPTRTPSGLGRGLGLALVWQAVARFEGDIAVRPGPGAEFRISLPLRVPAGAQA